MALGGLMLVSDIVWMIKSFIFCILMRMMFVSDYHTEGHSLNVRFDEGSQKLWHMMRVQT